MSRLGRNWRTKGVRKRTHFASNYPRFAVEQLEHRLMLHGDVVENAMAPDLDVYAMETRSIRVGEELVLDFYDAGTTVTDLDRDGHATEDTIRLQLDPDDGPTNASLTPDGILRWIPSSDQVGVFEFVVTAVDEGSPPLADAEVFMIEVLPNAAIARTSIDVTARTVTDFTLTDVNPLSTSAGEVISPRDYQEHVSGWYFGHST